MKQWLAELFLSWREKADTFKWLFFAALAVLVLLNVVIHPHHPHVHEESYVGFWPVFALGVGLVLIYLVKKILSHLVSVPEDFYESD
ncbi:MAG: hypothetical protein ACNI3A_01735 [Desulfovibrio sp.]|uniref:hypothetical protein n=1 Tax=Desulfovibrio sp. 7SRBS1 TaxID=3378064 RepID=UPI003B3C2044